MKPTRIIEEPKVQLCEDGVFRVMIKCDNDRIYRLETLAMMCKMKTAHGLWQRIKKHGWDHAKILAESTRRGQCLGGGAPSDFRDFHNGDYGALSGKSRFKNLEKIPEPGTWERQQ